MNGYNRIICIALAFVLIIVTAGSVAASVITVDDSSGANYTTICDAIKNAVDDDTILVYRGIYRENVNVNKSLMIISRSETPEDTVIQAADPCNNVFHVTADNVIIRGFNIKGANNNAGIYLNGVHDNIVSNNILSDNQHGIRLESSSNSILNNNNVSNNVRGIFLHSSSENNTLSNNILLNSNLGIYILNSSYNTLSGNILSNNDNGVHLESSSSNDLTNNTASNNDNGFFLEDSRNNRLEDNTADSNLLGIVLVDSSSNNTLNGNFLSNNNKDIEIVKDSYSAHGIIERILSLILN
jgi:parallel beta-helix repeat protein